MATCRIPSSLVIPGHEIVGRVEALGSGVRDHKLGERVGIPWLGHTCGHCPYCVSGHENLCDEPLFTGYTRDGGFASHVIADAAYAFGLPEDDDPVALAPLLCAGLIGWRSLVAAGPGERIGIYRVRRGGSYHHPGLHLAGTARLCLYAPGRRRCPGFRPLARRRLGRWLGRSAA